MPGMGSADNPVRLWPFRRLVAVHWPEEDDSDYLAIQIGITYSEVDGVNDIGCAGQADATPGYNYYGSGYHTSATYEYELLDQALYTRDNSDGGEWGFVGEWAEVTGLRTTDTETIGGAWYAYAPPFGGRSPTLWARFTPITDESGPVTVPFESHNFGGVAEITPEYLGALFAGVLGCDFSGDPEALYNYKAIDPTPAPLAVSSDLVSPIVVTYLGDVLTLVGVSTERPTPTAWFFGDQTPGYINIGPTHVDLPRTAWLLYRIPASSA